MAKNNQPRSKFPAMITYIIAVLALLCGLLLPLDTKALAGGGIDFKNMPVLQLAGAFNTLMANFGIKYELPFGAGLSAVYSTPISFFGLTKFDLGAILLILYALATLIALILLIPVCVMNRNKPRPRKIAISGEAIALAVLLAMALLDMVKTDNWNLSVYIPFGVTLLMLILQSLIYFKGSGFIKTVGFILSAVAVLVGVFNVFALIPALNEPVGNLLKNMQGNKPFATVPGMYSLGAGTYYGGAFIALLFIDFKIFVDFITAEPINMLVYISALVLAATVILDLFLTMFGIGKRTKKGMLVANLIRYILELVLIVVLIGSLFGLGGNFGLCLYILTCIVLIQLIITIARFIKYKKAHEKKAEKAAKPATTQSSVSKHEPIENTDLVSETAAAAAPASVAPYVITPDKKTEVIEKNIVYNVNTVYNGPLDNFIRKLSTEEKVEFAKIFLERNYGNLAYIPDYVVGGDNSRFFSSVFIYLSHVRDLVSDTLMNRLYEEVHLL